MLTNDEIIELDNLQALQKRKDRFLLQSEFERLVLLRSLLYHNSCLYVYCSGYHAILEDETHCPYCNRELYKSTYIKKASPKYPD